MNLVLYDPFPSPNGQTVSAAHQQIGIHSPIPHFIRDASNLGQVACTFDAQHHGRQYPRLPKRSIPTSDRDSANHDDRFRAGRRTVSTVTSPLLQLSGRPRAPLSTSSYFPCLRQKREHEGVPGKSEVDSSAMAADFSRSSIYHATPLVPPTSWGDLR